MARFSGEAVSQQMVDDLRRRIRDGRLRPGDRLPSIAELMEEFDVSQTVVKAALAELKHSGEVYGHQGKGTFVANTLRAHRFRRIPFRGDKATGSTFATEMTRLGLEPSTKLVEAGEAAAPAEIAERLQLSEGDPVVIRKRHMLGSGTPVQLATAYMPMSVAGDASIAFPDAVPTEIYRRLDSRGHRPIRFVEDIEVRRPSPEESAFLEVSEGLPVFVVARTAFDRQDTPVEATTNVLAGYRWCLTYEWREDEGGEK